MTKVVRNKILYNKNIQYNIYDVIGTGAIYLTLTATPVAVCRLL